MIVEFFLEGYHLQNDAAMRLLNTQSNSPLNQSLILPSTNQSSIGNLQSMSGKVIGNEISYFGFKYYPLIFNEEISTEVL